MRARGLSENSRRNFYANRNILTTIDVQTVPLRVKFGPMVQTSPSRDRSFLCFVTLRAACATAHFLCGGQYVTLTR